MMDSSANRQFEQKSKKLVKAFASSESGKTYLFFVGTDWYAMCRDLEYASSDIRGVRDALGDMYGPSNDKSKSTECTCLVSRYWELGSVQGVPSWKDIDYSLKELFKKVQKDDSVLIMFAGHGFESNDKTYYAPFDIIRKDIIVKDHEKKSEFIISTAISIDGIVKRLKKCSAKCKWLIVDACRNTVRGVRKPQEDQEYLNVSAKEGVVVLQSCSSGEYSYESCESGHGKFTRHLIDALRGAADVEKTGSISIGDVWTYIKTEMSRERGNICYTFRGREFKEFAEQNPEVTIEELKDYIITDNVYHEGLTIKQYRSAERLLEEAEVDNDRGYYIKAYHKVNEVKAMVPKKGGSLAIRADRIIRRCELLINKDEEIIEKDQTISELRRQLSMHSSTKELEAGCNKMLVDIAGRRYEFCYCPSGKFMMGSPDNEEGRRIDERLHEVTLTRGFWMLETAVTQKLWESVMEDNPSSFKGDDLPVNNVSLYQCRCFIDKLNRMKSVPKDEGFNFKLPTEAQWEYACRAGSSGAYGACNGISGNLKDMGWSSADEEIKIHEVKRKNPNDWGLYDMHGNLYEWCSDGYGDYPSKDVTDPGGPSYPEHYVNRGGKYSSVAKYCRSACRGHNAPWDYDEGLGFRIILEKSELEERSELEENKDPKLPDFSIAISDSLDEPKSERLITVRIGDISCNFCYCEPGEFDMGSSAGEEGRRENESRRHVSLTYGFWILETPVTQEFYYAVRKENPSSHQEKEIVKDQKTSEVKERFVDYPVVNVNWVDSHSFAKHLNHSFGKHLDTFAKKLTKFSSEGELRFRLPTEAEWEYACRAGEEGSHAGDLEERGWYQNNSDGHTHRVKSKAPNKWGVYDMHCNFGEWCLDEYLENLGEGKADNPVMLPEAGSSERVVRSGDGFAGDASSLRSDSRTGARPDEANPHIGFRLVLSFFDPEGKSRDGSEAESNH